MKILNIVWTFYAEMYRKPKIQTTNTNLPKIRNQGFEDLPEITLAELDATLR